MIDALARSESTQNLGFFVLQMRGDDESDGLSQNLSFRVAKNSLRTSIPVGDDPVQVFRNNRVIGTLYNGRQPRTHLVGSLLLGNVHIRPNVAFQDSSLLHIHLPRAPATSFISIQDRMAVGCRNTERHGIMSSTRVPGWALVNRSSPPNSLARCFMPPMPTPTLSGCSSAILLPIPLPSSRTATTIIPSF